jgi:hypothetical protein
MKPASGTFQLLELLAATTSKDWKNQARAFLPAPLS